MCIGCRNNLVYCLRAFLHRLIIIINTSGTFTHTANMGTVSDALLNTPGIAGMGPGAVALGVRDQVVVDAKEDGGGNGGGE